MSKLAIVTTLRVAPGRMDEYLPLLRAHRARCLQDEPGTLQIDMLKPVEDPASILIYVVYRDEAASIAHRTGPLLARHGQDAEGILLGATGIRCAVLD
jgi:(4S)-4-hydroxy-5-phosphonooxypentane-2,3-dione isomerase